MKSCRMGNLPGLSEAEGLAHANNLNEFQSRRTGKSQFSKRNGRLDIANNFEFR